MAEPVVATYSIAACDLDAGQWGVAVQSKFLAVGSVVPWAEPEVGAIATQAYANPRYGPDGLALLRDGLSARARSSSGSSRRTRDATSASSASSTRAGRRASWTGAGLHRLGRAPHRAGLRGAGQHPRRRGDGRRARGRRSRRTRSLPLARRLLDCLAAAQAAGGDRRGQQSASLLVVERDGGYARPLRHRSSTCASTTTSGRSRSCARIYGLHDRLFGVTPREDWLPLDGELRGGGARAARRARLRRRARRALDRWAGVENLEERVDGDDAIDPVVLDALREASP